MFWDPKNNEYIYTNYNKQELESFLGNIAPLLINKEYSDYINFNRIFKDSCAFGKFEYVKILIERGLIETKNKDICLKNGLESACFYGHIDIVELILSRFIFYIDIRNNALEYACEGGHVQIAKLMMEYDACDYEHGLERACMGGHIDCVNLMISKGIDKDFIGECMKTLEIYDSESNECSLAILDILVLNSDSLTYHDRYYQEYKTKQLLLATKLHESLVSFVISKIL